MNTYQSESDLREEEDIKDLREFAEKVAELHKWCAGHPNPTISFYRDMPYHTTRELLKDAIKEGWDDCPIKDGLEKADVDDIYDIWVNSGENLEYSANAWYQAKRREAHEVDIYGEDTNPDKPHEYDIHEVLPMWDEED